jgi:hypothetical protein
MIPDQRVVLRTLPRHYNTVQPISLSSKEETPSRLPLRSPACRPRIQTRDDGRRWRRKRVVADGGPGGSRYTLPRNIQRINTTLIMIHNSNNARGEHCSGLNHQEIDKMDLRV